MLCMRSRASMRPADRCQGFPGSWHALRRPHVMACSSEPSLGHKQCSKTPRRLLLTGASMGLLGLGLPLGAMASTARVGEVQHTDEQWLQILGKDSYRILRQAKTEPPFTSQLNEEKRPGMFVCAGCGAPLFPSTAKFNSGTGWPSFYDAVPGAVDLTADNSIPFMPRTEVRCHKCQGHLGHVFQDGPAPTGLRYCMNGLAMSFSPAAA